MIDSGLTAVALVTPLFEVQNSDGFYTTLLPPAVAKLTSKSQPSLRDRFRLFLVPNVQILLNSPFMKGDTHYGRLSGCVYPPVFRKEKALRQTAIACSNSSSRQANNNHRIDDLWWTGFEDLSLYRDLALYHL